MDAAAAAVIIFYDDIVILNGYFVASFCLHLQLSLFI
jgi:hypothetical protein